MELSQDFVGRITDAITSRNAVPLPGGHGALFAKLRERHGEIGNEPGAAARCYVCLALLGDEDGDERWNRKEWLPHAAAWFDIYCPEIAADLDAARWRYLLAAMLKVTEDWIAERSSRKHLLPNLVDCYRLARDRLGALTRRAGEASMLTRPIAMPDGEAIQTASPKWQTVASELSGPNAGRVELLYFLHVFHSSLGVAQHSPDERYEQRRLFYSQLRNILEASLGGSCSLCGARARIAEALGTTAVMNAAGQPSIKTDMLAAQLPACFQPANCRTRPPLRAGIAIRLREHSEACERLLAAHDLGEALADLAMDFVRAGRVDVPAFRKSDYGFLLSLFRDGRRRYEAQVLGNALPESEAGLVDERPDIPRSAIKSFLERMTTDKLIEPARERLTYLAGEIDWLEKSTSERCAICHGDARAKGR